MSNYHDWPEAWPPNHWTEANQSIIQPGRVQQVGKSYSQKHTVRMFYIQFFKKNQLGMVSLMWEALRVMLINADNVN